MKKLLIIALLLLATPAFAGSRVMNRAFSGDTAASGAFSANGVNNITYPSGTYLTGLSGMTVATWVRMNDNFVYNGGTYTLAGKRNATDGFVMDYNNTLFRFVAQTLGGGFSEASNFVINPEKNRWYFVVGVFNGTQNIVYVDGVAASPTATVGSVTVANTVYLSAGSRAASFFLPGDLDNFRIWNVALTANEISELYSTGIAPRRDNLVVEWLLDEGSGTTATDTSGNARNGTLSASSYTDGIASAAPTRIISRTLTR